MMTTELGVPLSRDCGNCGADRTTELTCAFTRMADVVADLRACYGRRGTSV
jgi:hypothetical protein